MKELNLMALVALTVCFLSSCQEEEQREVMSGVEVRFSSQIQTRAVNNQWEEGDEIGVFMHYANGPLSDATLVDNVSNFKYLATSSGNLDPATELDKMYYPMSSAVSFVAYYPFDNVEGYSVNLDVSNQKKYSEIDLLYSNNQKSVQSTSSPLSLEFEHKLSKVSFLIKAGYGIDSDDLSGLTLTIRKAVTEATFSLSDAAFTLGNGSLDVKALTKNLENGGVQAEAIMIPQDCGNVSVIVSLASGKNFMYTLSGNQKWESGKSYNYGFDLSDKTVNTSLSATIKDWSEGQAGTLESVNSQAWDGTINTSWYADDLLSMTLFQPEDLAGLAKLVNEGNSFEGKTLYLSTDLDMNNKIWDNPIGNVSDRPFKGTFIGGGHQIKNLNISLAANSKVAGLFGYTRGVVKQLIVNGLCAAETDKDSIVYVGGIVAINDGTIDACRSYVDITGKMEYAFEGQTNIYVGGIAGLNKGKVSVCQNYGAVLVENINTNKKAYIHVGGISGGNSNLITDCENTRDLIARNGQVRAGGITGLTSSNTNGGTTTVGDILNCKNIGDIIVETSHIEAAAGGIVGRHSGGSTIKNVTNKGNVKAVLTSGTNIYGGGITGQVDGATIHSGENHGDVNVIGVSGEETNAMSGGIVGYAINDSEIHQATNSGVATGSMAANCFNGGIVGYSKSDDGSVVYDCCSNEGLPAKWVGNATDENDFIDKTEHTHE